MWGMSVTATALLVARGLANVGATAAADAVSPASDQALLAHYVAAAMWTAFGCAVVSLIASAFGGWMGARHVHHVYHLRKYPVHGQ